MSQAAGQLRATHFSAGRARKEYHGHRLNHMCRRRLAHRYATRNCRDGIVPRSIACRIQKPDAREDSRCTDPDLHGDAITARLRNRLRTQGIIDVSLEQGGVTPFGVSSLRQRRSSNCAWRLKEGTLFCSNHHEGFRGGERTLQASSLQESGQRLLRCQGSFHCGRCSAGCQVAIVYGDSAGCGSIGLQGRHQWLSRDIKPGVRSRLLRLRIGTRGNDEEKGE